MVKKKLKAVVLAKRGRKLLENIQKSLEDIRAGRVKPFIAEELRKR